MNLRAIIVDDEELARQVLREQLGSTGGVDVIVAADAIALLGPKAKRAVRTLLEVAAQPRQWADPGQAAEKALARIGSAAIADLEAALRDPDEGIRRAAEMVLERLRAPGGEPRRRGLARRARPASAPTPRRQQIGPVDRDNQWPSPTRPAGPARRERRPYRPAEPMPA